MARKKTPKAPRLEKRRVSASQPVDFADADGGDTLIFPEIGGALVGAEAAAYRGLCVDGLIAEDSSMDAIDPEYFMFLQSIGLILRRRI
jgi:hypothetical protein